MSAHRFLGVVTLLLLTLSAAWSRPVAIPPDHSLAPAVYSQKYGMPAPGKRWTTDDYVAAFACLPKISAAGPALLPRFDSLQSGVLFRKLISLDDEARHVQESDMDYFKRVQDRLQATNQAMLTYASASISPMFDAETLEISRCDFHLAVLSLQLGHRLEDGVRQKPHPNPQALALIKKGLNTMTGGLSVSMGGMVTMLGDTSSCRLTALRRYAQGIRPDWALGWKLISKEQRSALKVHLADVGGRQTDSGYRADLQALLNSTL